MQRKYILAENNEAKYIITGKNGDMLYYFSCTKNLGGDTNRKIVRMNLNGELSAEYKVTFSNFSTNVADIVVLDDGSLLVCISVNSSEDIYRISQDFKECFAVDIDFMDTYSICYNRNIKKIYIGSYSSNLLTVYDLKL
jgi:hypothetical protein